VLEFPQSHARIKASRGSSVSLLSLRPVRISDLSISATPGGYPVLS